VRHQTLQKRADVEALSPGVASIRETHTSNIHDQPPTMKFHEITEIKQKMKIPTDAKYLPEPASCTKVAPVLRGKESKAGV